jgi:site-specific DNA recombinase
MKKSAPPITRAVGYVRVSTGKQEMSPAAQEVKIRAIAELQGAIVVEVFCDRESAKAGSMYKRDGLAQILEMAKRGQVNRIIVAKLDRLTRSVMDLGEILTLLDRHGVSLVSATETWMDTGSAAGRMILNIITAVAQWEREAIGERTSAVLQHKRSVGQVYGLIPYGYRAVGRARVDNGHARKFAGKKLEPVPAEQVIIRQIQRSRQKGGTLRAIAELLNAQKVPTKVKGGKWYASTVANVLRLSA